MSRTTVAAVLKKLFTECLDHVVVLANNSPGTLTFDGMSRGGANLVNFWYTNAGGRVHLLTEDFGWQSQDAATMASRVLSVFEKLDSVVAVCTDRPSVMRKARREVLARRSDICWLFCMEHAAHTIAKKLKNLYPWAREASKGLKKALRFQSRKKRLNALLKEKLRSPSRQCRKLSLKLPRSTRFGSLQASAATFVYNLSLLKKVPGCCSRTCFFPISHKPSSLNPAEGAGAFFGLP